MSFKHLLYDSQTQTGAAIPPRSVYFVEPSEQVRQMLRRDSNVSILHHSLNEMGFLGYTDLNSTIYRMYCRTSASSLINFCAGHLVLLN